MLCTGCADSNKRDTDKKSAAPKSMLFSTGAASTTGGKRESNEIDPTKIAERDDIVSINMFWQGWPWLSNAEDEVVGFRVPVYFVSGETGKGSFVATRILVWVSVVERGIDGRAKARPVHTWEFTREQAMGFRVRRLAVTGYHYGFMLAWPETLDLTGKEIEIEFGLERASGSMLTSGGRRFRVPLAGRNATSRPVRSMEESRTPPEQRQPTTRPRASQRKVLTDEPQQTEPAGGARP
ncbi:MAG: hypothetical protein ACKVS9_17395 [Phycisphaerae bacterium]